MVVRDFTAEWNGCHDRIDERLGICHLLAVAFVMPRGELPLARGFFLVVDHGR